MQVFWACERCMPVCSRLRSGARASCVPRAVLSWAQALHYWGSSVGGWMLYLGVANAPRAHICGHAF